MNPSADRVAVLAALSCVDHLLVFDDDTCTGVLDAFRPDIYVKGGDHRLEDLPEAPARIASASRSGSSRSWRTARRRVIERIRGDDGEMGVAALSLSQARASN